MLRGVLFDVDDTLVDYESAARSAILAHLSDVGLPADEQAYVTWNRLMEEAFARFVAGELSFVEQRRVRARAMTGRAMTAEEADRWLEGYVRRLEASWAVFPDVVAVLDVLAATPGLRLGVISNMDTVYQRSKLGFVGLADRFGCLICADAVGVAKPDPAIFRAGCCALGLRPEETAYVGDRLDIDAIGARDAGLLGIWLDRSGRGGAPAGLPVISSLAELPELLGRAGRGLLPV